MKRGFGVGTLEMSLDEGLDEAIEILRMHAQMVADGQSRCWWMLARPDANKMAILPYQLPLAPTTYFGRVTLLSHNILSS